MTVQAIEADITYTFNDEGQYPFAFDILKPKDVTVQFIDNQGIRHVLAMGTDYLVVDNAGSRYIEIISTCGFIGQPGQLFIFRDMPVEQPTDWVNNEELDMELLEKSFDRIIMILQQFNTQMTSELAAITWRDSWKTNTVYEARDLVQAPNSNIYLATRSHTAGVFETDLLAGYWNLVIDIAVITEYAAAFDAKADITYVDAELADKADITYVDAGLATKADAATLFSDLGISDFIKTLLDDVDASAAQTTLGISSFIKTLLDDVDASAARSTLGITEGAAWIKIGSFIIQCGSTVIPSAGSVTIFYPLSYVLSSPIVVACNGDHQANSTGKVNISSNSDKVSLEVVLYDSTAPCRVNWIAIGR